MENQNTNSRTSLPENSQKESLIPLVLILGLEVGSVILAAWFDAYREVSGGPVLLVIPLILIGFPFLGITGLICALRYIKKKGRLLFLPTLIASTSLLMATITVPVSLAKGLSPMLSPIAERTRMSAIEKSSRDYKNVQENHYSALLKKFQQPQKIVDVKYNYYILLESGYVLKMLGCTATEAEKKIKQSLINKTIGVDLPNYSDFSENYTPGSRTPLFQTLGLHKDYGEIPALIRINGELINTECDSDYRKNRQ